MTLLCRFAVFSDPHVALPHTIWNNPSRFHLVEVSIPLVEQILSELEQQDLDFLLIPGDLTQHGELENHNWLRDRLAQLPYPVYVVPGNHDVLSPATTEKTLGLSEFPALYEKFGYSDPQPYYTQQLKPGLRLIGLNSIAFDDSGTQHWAGWLDEAQLIWLKEVLAEAQDEFVMVMVHHNVVEHLPGQSRHALSSRYMVHNAADLRDILLDAGVSLMFTGHLHVQDVACDRGLYEITTGSLVSYPHPYRILTLHDDGQGRSLHVESRHMPAVPGWPDLLHQSREWMGDRSLPFMLKLLTSPPLSLETAHAEELVKDLRYFWADIAHGDRQFHFERFPSHVQRFFHRFGAVDESGSPRLIDNHAVLRF